MEATNKKLTKGNSMNLINEIGTKDKEGNELTYRKVKVTGSEENPNVYLNLANLTNTNRAAMVEIDMRDQHSSNGNGGTLKIRTDVEIDGTVTVVQLAQFFNKEDLKALAFEIIRTF